MSSGFPVTRELMASLDARLMAIAAPLLPAGRKPEPDGSFHWELRAHSAEGVQVAKAVRMISGIRAAMHLADNGWITEAGSILRIVGDCNTEILALTEGLLEGRLTQSQQKFVDQYFAPLPESPEAFEKAERERFVTREELFKAHRRLATKGSIDADEWLRVTRFLNKGFDSYVHAAYLTAMELYRGDTHSFMLAGSPVSRSRCVAQRAVAGKLHEVLIALSFMAMSRGMQDLYVAIRADVKRLEDSNEDSFNCDSIPPNQLVG